MIFEFLAFGVTICVVCYLIARCIWDVLLD